MSSEIRSRLDKLKKRMAKVARLQLHRVKGQGMKWKAGEPKSEGVEEGGPGSGRYTKGSGGTISKDTYQPFIDPRDFDVADLRSMRRSGKYRQKAMRIRKGQKMTAWTWKKPDRKE
jgi:hypothetical protein